MVVVGLIIAAAGLYIQLRPQVTEMHIEFLSAEELTLAPTLSGLVGSYTYLGTEVEHLWRIQSIWTNSGDTTLIGSGPSANILGEGIILPFPAGTRILDVQVDVDEPVVTLSTVDSNKIQASFAQWRSSEILTADFLVSADAAMDEFPLPSRLRKNRC